MFSPFGDNRNAPLTIVGLVVLAGPVFVFASFLLPESVQSADLNSVRISVLELVSMALGYLAGSAPRN